MPCKSGSLVAMAFFLASTVPATADVTLINVFEVPRGETERVIAAWEKARDFLSDEPGYIATALHRSIGDDARFQLINVARWESPQLFSKAIARMNEAEIFPKIDGLRINPALYRVIRTDEVKIEGVE